MQRDAMKVVQRFDEVQASHMALEARLMTMETKLTELQDRENTIDKLNIIADTVTAFFNKILDAIDPHWKFSTWEAFMRSEECRKEAAAIREQTKTRRYDWWKHADTLKKFKWHKKVIKEVEKAGLPLRSFSILLAEKKIRNECHHDIRSDRTEPIDLDALYDVLERFDKLAESSPSEEVDEAFHLLVQSLNDELQQE